MNNGNISSKFKQLIQKGNINSALKLLTNNMSKGILPLTDATVQQLELKHPESKEGSPHAARTPLKTDSSRCFRGYRRSFSAQSNYENNYEVGQVLLDWMLTDGEGFWGRMLLVRQIELKYATTWIM